MEKDKYVCKLCNKQYKNDEMSEEHYPAKSVGNDDIGKFDLTKFIDIFDSKSIKEDIYQKLKEYPFQHRFPLFHQNTFWKEHLLHLHLELVQA